MATVCGPLGRQRGGWISEPILTPTDLERTNYQAELLRLQDEGKDDCSGQTTDGSLFCDDRRRYPTHFSQSKEEDSSDYWLLNWQINPLEPRKKSGEIVRPALRRPVRTRLPPSLPGRIKIPKAVHFDADLARIRHFFQAESPSAVSSSSSSADSSDSNMEYSPCAMVSRRPRTRQFEWEIKTPNFPADRILSRPQRHVMVERVFLSSDNETLIGVIAVENMSFEKTVIARFTFDYWKTISEVAATFSDHAYPGQQDDGYDRFAFSIKLADQVILQAKTMFFSVRYCANGCEYWDNNHSFNYQVDFMKKRDLIVDSKSRPVNADPLPESTQNNPGRYCRSRYDFGVSISRAIGGSK